MTDPALIAVVRWYRDAIRKGQDARVRAAEERGKMNAQYAAAADHYTEADSYRQAALKLGATPQELDEIPTEDLSDILRDGLDRYGHRADNDETDWHAP